MAERYTCPICGYPDLAEAPRGPGGSASYENCASCGFEFGYHDDDQGFSYEAWREKWIADGMPWDSTSVPKPPGWDPAAQLRNLTRSS